MSGTSIAQTKTNELAASFLLRIKPMLTQEEYELIVAQLQKAGVDATERVLEAAEKSGSFKKLINAMRGVSEEEQSQKAKDFMFASGVAKDAISTSEGTLKKLLTTAVDTVQSIYQKMVQSSPLLQSVESLFNLAMQLFFMPLGTKLATVMLPAVLELVDGVMEIWDGFEGKSLGELLTDAMDLGISLLGKYFNNIGDALQTQGGTVASIGKLLSSLGSFIQSDFFSTLVNAFTTLIGWVADFFPQIVGLITSFMIMERVIGLAQIAATADKTGLAGLIVGVGAAAAVGGGVAAGSAFAATGGYIPAVNGGTLVTVGEGGEGEYIVPESKKNLFAESVASANLRRNGGESPQITYNITVNGYTDTDLTDKIKDAVSDQVSASNYRRGF